MRIRYRKHRGVVTASHQLTALFAEGKTRRIAKRILMEDLRDLKADLQASRTHLGPFPLRVLAYLEGR
jgi:hypothetical protein